MIARPQRCQRPITKQLTAKRLAAVILTGFLLFGLQPWSIGAWTSGDIAHSQTLREDASHLSEIIEHYGEWSVMFGEYNGGSEAAEAWVQLLTDYSPLLEDVEANIIEIGFVDDNIHYYLLGGTFSEQQDAADLCILMRIREVECGILQVDRTLISLAIPMLTPNGTRLPPTETLSGLGPYLPNFEEAMATTGNEITRLDQLYGFWMEETLQQGGESSSGRQRQCPPHRLVLSPMSVKIFDRSGLPHEMNCNFFVRSPEGQQQSHIHVSCEDGSRANFRQTAIDRLVLEQLFEPDEAVPTRIGVRWRRCSP